MDYLEKVLRLPCNNMKRKDDELKTIICTITNKQCVCSSCPNEYVGFVANLYCKDCPGYENK